MVATRKSAAHQEASYQPPTLAFSPVRLTGASARLQRAVSAPGHTVLVCGPAASGKTVLVAEWLRRVGSATDSAWVSLTEQRVAPEQLWSTLRAALGLPAGVGTRALETPPDELPAAILAEMRERSTATVLVLDDAHLLCDAWSLAGVQYLLTHAPATLTTIVIGRYEPPLRWHQLGLTGRLTRIDADALAFGPQQVATLLAQHECPATEAEIAALTQLTRGWAGLVRIAAIHLAAHAHDGQAAWAALAQAPPAVADFLVGELLTSLEPEALEFLLRTAVPSAFCVALAEELVGAQAARIVEFLLRNNFPIETTVHSGTLWYGYHPMLRIYLLAEARRRWPDQVVTDHRRCAGWFVDAQLPARALDHVVADPDPRVFTAFLREHGPRLVFDGAATMLFGHLNHSDIPIDDGFVLALRVFDALDRADTMQAAALADLLRDHAPVSRIVSSEILRALTSAVLVEVAMVTGPDWPTPIWPPPDTGHLDIDCYIVGRYAAAYAGAAPEDAAVEPRLRHGLAASDRAGLPRLTL